MIKMERFLNRAGYATINLDYPSTRKSIRRLVQVQIHDTVQQCKSRNIKNGFFNTSE